jgi:hypothetical protein
MGLTFRTTVLQCGTIHRTTLRIILNANAFLPITGIDSIKYRTSNRYFPQPRQRIIGRQTRTAADFLLTICGSGVFYRWFQIFTWEVIMTDVLVPIAVFTMIGWIVWVIFSSVRRYKTAKVQGEVAEALLARFDSAQSMLAYVETEGGRKFLSSLAQESGTAYGSILDCTRWGLVFLIVGGTVCWMHAAGVVDHDPQVMGILAVALGIGLEAAAVVSYYASRALGLLGPAPKA